jgi:hypothetical protein
MQQMAQVSSSWLPRDKLMCNNTTVRNLLRFLWAKYVLLLTVEFTVDLAIGLCWRKPTLPFLSTNPCIPIKNTIILKSIRVCACEKTQLSSVLFYIVTAVYTFVSRFVIKETPNIRWPVERRSCGVENRFWQDIYFFLSLSTARCKGTLVTLSSSRHIPASITLHCNAAAQRWRSSHRIG